MFKAYYQLTKPGIIYGNLLTAAAGFLLASDGHVELGLFVALLAGTALTIAAACVCNNVLDRDIDRKMARTRKRALVQGTITAQAALVYAAVLGAGGALVLGLYTNGLTLALGIGAFVAYVAIYGVGKRKTVYGTLIGSVSGATPPVAGYTAVTGQLDMAAFLLFAVITVWQMPHFYAIAMYRRKDYAAAHIPVLPVEQGFAITKKHIVWYIAAFIPVSLAFSFYGYTGYCYAIVMAFVGARWLHLAIQGFKTKDDVAWARQVFFFSLKVMLVLSLMLSVGSILP